MKENIHFKKMSSIADAVMHTDYLLKDSDRISIRERACQCEVMRSGIDSLDDILGSFEPGHFYLIGGRPGIGKTTLLLQVATNIALTTNKPIYIITLEMLEKHIVHWMISQIADIEQRVVKSGNLSEKQRQQMINCWAEIDTMSVRICETVVTMDEIKWFVKEQIKDGILLIDYFQLIYGSISDRKIPPKVRMKEIARELSCLAKENNIPVVVSSQLPRSIELRADKRPVLQDFEIIGEIDQYADGVIFVYRDAYYMKDAGDEAEITIAKNPLGPVGTANVRFNKERLLFEDKGQLHH